MKTATNPLDRVRLLSQTGDAKTSNVFHLCREIYRKEGMVGFWSGNATNLLRVVPSKAVVFSSQDIYRSMSEGYISGGTTASFAAGGAAGMTASLITYPLDLIRGRIAGQLASQHYRGIVQTTVNTVRDEGLLALYKGVTPTILGAVPYEGIKFGTVGLLESIFPGDASPTRKMMFGAAGGIMAGLVTYPNDTVRRMLQLQGRRGKEVEYTGYWDCVRKIYRTHGIGRLYSGLTVNLIRMAPNTALQFYFYSLLKNWSEMMGV